MGHSSSHSDFQPVTPLHHVIKKALSLNHISSKITMKWIKKQILSNSRIHPFRAEESYGLTRMIHNVLRPEVSYGLEQLLRKIYEESCPRDGLKSILKNYSGRMAIEKFVCAGPFEKNSFDTDQLAAVLRDIATINNKDGHLMLYDSMYLSMQVISSFKSFICSSYYADWRLQESEAIINLLDPELYGEDVVAVDMIASETQHSGEKGITMSDVLAAVRSDYLPVVVEDDAFLFQLMCTMENAPISFSIVAKRCGGDFPLTYANRHFEVFTGYDRRLVVGNRMSFAAINFAPTVSQLRAGAIDKLTTYMDNGMSHGTTVSSTRQNGETYESYIYLQPIFNGTGNYKFLACFQVCANDTNQIKLVRRLAYWLWKARRDCFNII